MDHWEDPLSPQCKRVLTVLLASEYYSNGSPQLVNEVAGQVRGINPQVFEAFEHWHCRGQGLGELSIRN